MPTKEPPKWFDELCCAAYERNVFVLWINKGRKFIFRMGVRTPSFKWDMYRVLGIDYNDDRSVHFPYEWIDSLMTKNYLLGYEGSTTSDKLINHLFEAFGIRLDRNRSSAPSLI